MVDLVIVVLVRVGVLLVVLGVVQQLQRRRQGLLLGVRGSRQEATKRSIFSKVGNCGPVLVLRQD